MSRLTILEAPHPVLKKPAAAVESIDARLLQLMDGMLEAMYEAPGVGLAAPQVGVLERVIVLDVSEEKNAPLRLINPHVVWASESRTIAEEGCLSLPGLYADVERAEMVRVAYMDETGTAHEIEGRDLLGRCLQHEIDHLDGILFTDHLSALKRRMMLRKLAKQRRVKA